MTGLNLNFTLILEFIRLYEIHPVSNHKMVFGHNYNENYYNKMSTVM